MGRILEKYDKYYMKMAMLKQEEAFKEQVSELHRLYRVQKQLTKEIKNTASKRQNESKNLERCKPENSKTYSYQDKEKPRLILDLERPAEYNEENNEDMAQDIEKEDDVQLTLATGCSSWRKKTETSDSGATFSSSSTDSGGSNLKLNEWATSFQRPVVIVPTDRKNGFAAMEPKEKHSWRFQCLSLSMT